MLMPESQPNHNESKHRPIAWAFERKVQAAMNTNSEIGPRTYPDSTIHTVRIPNNAEELLAIFAAMLVDQSASPYIGELALEGRVLEILQRQGVSLFEISTQTEPFEPVVDQTEILGTDNMQDGMYFQKPFRNDEKVIFNRNTKPFDLSHENNLRAHANDLL